MGLYENKNGILSPIAGRGRAEYGASTVRTGTSSIAAGIPAGGVATVEITFTDPMPDANYLVDISFTQVKNFAYSIGKRQKTKFTVIITNTGTGDYYAGDTLFKYTAFKLYTDTEYNKLLQVPSQIDDIYKSNGMLGAKNLLTYPFADTNKELNGITYTDNGDGTVTANGTATGGNSWYMFSAYNKTPNIETKLQDGVKYILSGCPQGGSENTYFLLYYVTTGESERYVDTGNGVEVEKGTGNRYWGIYIMEGTTVSNLVFRPMLRLACDTDSTYVPYAATNKELTDVLQVEEIPITWNLPDGVVMDYNYSHCYRVGKLCTLLLAFRIGIQQANELLTIGSIPSKYIKPMPASDKPTQNAYIQSTKKYTGNSGQFQTETYTIGIATVDGSISIRSDTVVDKNNHFVSAIFTFPTR